MTEAAPDPLEERRRSSPIVWIIVILLGGLVLCLGYAFRSRFFANNALFHLQRKNTSEALERAEQAHAMGLNEASYLSLLVRIHAARQEPRSVLEAAQQLLAMNQISAEDTQTAAFAALELDDASQIQQWLPILRRRINMQSEAANFARGVLLALKDERKEAIESLAPLTPDDPALAYFAALWLGRAYRGDGQPTEALLPLRQAHLLRPRALAPLEEEVRCWREMGDADQFRYQLDLLRRQGGRAKELVEEMADCRSWMDAAIHGQPVGMPPEQLPIFLSEISLPKEPAPISVLSRALLHEMDAPSLIELGRALEAKGAKELAHAAYEDAVLCKGITAESDGATSDSLFAARWSLMRLDQKAEALPEMAALASEAAAQMHFAGEWFEPDQMRPTRIKAPNASFNGGLYSTGGVILQPSAKQFLPAPGRHPILILASASTVRGIGAWAELRCGNKTERFYVNSAVPTLIQSSVYLQPGQTQVQISFTNDESDPRTKEDRNLYLYGVGIGHFAGAASRPQSAPASSSAPSSSRPVQ